MIVNIIMLVINLVIGAFVFYRCGRQSAYNELMSEYKRVCQQNEKLWRLIEDNSCDGKGENK